MRVYLPMAGVMNVTDGGNMRSADELAAMVDDIPDFPEKGVIFRETSPLFFNKWPETVQAMLGQLKANELKEIDAFVGLDARGFSLAGAMAAVAGKGLVKARKAGKLPDPLFKEEYKLEYGTAAIEMKPGAGKVWIVDDVLATGGTLTAAANLCFRAGYEVMGMETLIDLTHLNDFEWNGMKCRSVLQYDENGYIPQGQKPVVRHP